jgi:hypothetical protein
VPVTKVPETKEKLKKAIKQFHAVEAQLAKEYKKTPELRDLEGLIEKYKGIDVDPDSPLVPYIKYRIQNLNTAIARRAHGKEFEQLVSGASAKQKEWDMKRTELELKSTEQREVIYAAQGVLMESVLYTGGATGPKRFVVIDHQTGIIVAYVQDSAGNLDLMGKVGKQVGVLGDVTYDIEARANVVDAQQVTVLLEDVEAPAMPAPTIGPIPSAFETAEQPQATYPGMKVEARTEPIPEPQAKIELPAEPLPEPEWAAEPIPEIRPTPSPSPAPTPEPRPQFDWAEEPLPEIQPLPTPTPKPIESPEEIVVTPVKPVKPLKPAEPVKPAPVIKTRVIPPIATPQTRPLATTLPVVRAVPSPTTQPTSRPAEDIKLLPPTDLPVAEIVDPPTQPIAEEEYD